MMSKTMPLKFKVAPHIVEDLGLNLYTSLPRVLVEFVANAYDADSDCARISLNQEGIRKARENAKSQFESERASGKVDLQPLETRTLPADLTITIEDNGIGMSRDELNDKFLVAGRRRRIDDKQSSAFTTKGRTIMGRKGLGKLAGFGVAKVVEVITRKEGETASTKITLDYDELVKVSNVHEIAVPDELVHDGSGIADHGTRIVLSKLLYDPLKSRQQTIQAEIADQFALIDPSEFRIEINGREIEPLTPTLAYAWPDPDDVPIDEFVNVSLDREGGGTSSFKYRIRFTGKEQSLPADRRGVRVYAHKRLAATPSLLGADTNMHGFRMTDYMDGVVHADFIDEQDTDYIATDRQSLRWDSPLLSGMHEYLSRQITEACKMYQAKRDKDAKEIVLADKFTSELIGQYDFSNRERKLAFRIAETLEKGCKQGLKDPVYLNTLPAFVKGIGHGTIVTAISQLADSPNPEISKVVHEIGRLAADEFDQFVHSAKARLKGIKALKRIVEHVDFKAKRNEKHIQQICEKCPWLVDPTYTQFLTADVSLGTVFQRLAKELKIGDYASTSDDKKEPDLVFLIGNVSLQRLVIVELKATNVRLEADNLTQLEYYMQRAEDWLADHGHPGFQIHGHLIGTKPDRYTKSEGAVALRRRMKEAGPDASWKVRDYTEVLKETEAAHAEIISIQTKLDAEESD